MNRRGALFALAATILWSGNFIVARAMNGEIPPVTLSLLRWLSACVFIMPFCAGDCLRSWPAIRAHWKYYVLTALTGVSLFTVLLYVAAESTNALNMVLIATSSPVFTLILARIFLKQNLPPLRITGVLIAISGVFILAIRGDLELLRNFEFHPGDLFALGAAIVFAVYTIQLRYRPAGLGLGVFISVLFFIGFVSMLPFAAWELAHTDIDIHFGWPMFLAAVYLGLGTSVGGFWFWNKAVASIGPGNAMLIYYTIPFFGGIEAALLLGEPILWVHLVSGALILCGILLASRNA